MRAKLDTEKGRGIGKDGAKTVYKLFKETFPAVINFHSDLFVTQLTDVVYFYKNLKDSKIKETVIENIKFNRRMVTLDTQYMPSHIYESMNSEYEYVKNRIVEYEPIDLEEELESKGFFDKKKEDIKEEPFKKEENLKAIKVKKVNFQKEYKKKSTFNNRKSAYFE